MRNIFTLFVIALLFSASTVVAQNYVPDELEGWQQWVLKDKEYLGCPFHFDRNTSDRSNFLCAWPDRVTVNDRAVEVIARQNVPSIHLVPGTYRVSGRFAWGERPGVLRVPPESGLLSLT